MSIGILTVVIFLPDLQKIAILSPIEVLMSDAQLRAGPKCAAIRSKGTDRPLQGYAAEPFHAPRGLNPRALFAACSGALRGLRDRVLSVAYDAGLFAAELVAIEVDDIVPAIDADARRLRIRCSKGDREGQGRPPTYQRSVRAITPAHEGI